ncbi:MAG TPA: hypothetical protein VMS22_22105 [Candidatus Eisenbacteria bacterium]|nr:hypothetical protein [Candidatus Eisenbacteria bacterium]
MTPRARIAALIALVAATPVRAEPLPVLLDLVARNARFPSPARADVRLERQDRGATTVVQVVMLGSGRTIYVETRDGTRALVRPGKVILRTGARVARSAPGARLAGSDVLFEDLAVFTPGLLKIPQVSDEGPTGTVVTGAPGLPSAWALIVLTIDPADHTILRTKYYERSISNLAAFGRNEDFQSVDGHQRPGRTTVEGTLDRTTTRLDLTWRSDPDIPHAVFTPAGLRGASTITW